MIKLKAAAIAACLAASGAGAQDRPIELGLDAGVSIGLGDNSRTAISIPAQAFRAGFGMTDRVSIEPKFGLNIISGDGESVSLYRAEVGLLYHLAAARDRMRSGVYIRPFGGLSGFSAGSGENDVSDTNGLIGVGLGLKVPLLSRLSSRFEANVAGSFGDGSSTEIGLLAGLSFFTR